MIELKVNGIVLSIGDEIIERQFETSIYDRELKATDFTLPIDLPIDDNTKKAFNLINRIDATNTQRDYDAELVVSGCFTNLVTLKIVEVSNREKIIRASLIGTYGSFKTFLNGKKLRSLDFGGVRVIGNVLSAENYNIDLPGYTTGISYTPCDTAAHMLDVAQGVVETDYVFYLAHDDKANLPGVHDGDSINIINNFRGYMVTPTERYQDPILETIYHAFHPDSGYNARFFWVPQFRLWYVLKQCFEEIGFTVVSTLDTDNNFKKIALHNSYAINKCIVDNDSIPGYTYIEHQATSIDPKNHVPDVEIIDFITEVGKAFNLQYDIDWTNKMMNIYQLKNETPTSNNLIDITHKVSPDPDISFEEEDVNNGYEFSFETSGDVKGDPAKQDLSQYNYIGMFSNESELRDAPGPYDANDLAFVRSTNTYYLYDGNFWELISYNLAPYKTSTADNLQQIKTRVQPMPMVWGTTPFVNYTTLDLAGASGSWTSPIRPTSSIGIEGRGLLAIQQRDSNLFIYTMDGIYTSDEAKEKPIYIANWLKLQWNTSFDDEFGPLGSNTAYDAKGYDHGHSSAFNPFALGGYDLVWHTPNDTGLFEEHRPTVYMLQTSKVVTYQVLFDAKMYSQINFNTAWFLIDGQLFRCVKGKLRLPLPEVAEITFRRQ